MYKIIGNKFKIYLIEVILKNGWKNLTLQINSRKRLFDSSFISSFFENQY